MVGEGEGGPWIGTGGVGDRSEGARVWTHSATSVTEEVWVAPPSEVYRRVGTVEVALTRGQTKAGSHPDDSA